MKEIIANFPGGIWGLIAATTGTIVVLIGLFFLVKAIIKASKEPVKLTGRAYWLNNQKRLQEYFKYNRYSYPYR